MKVLLTILILILITVCTLNVAIIKELKVSVATNKILISDMITSLENMTSNMELIEQKQVDLADMTIGLKIEHITDVLGTYTENLWLYKPVIGEIGYEKQLSNNFVDIDAKITELQMISNNIAQYTVSHIQNIENFLTKATQPVEEK